MKRLTLILSALLLIAAGMYGQIDTVFWMAAPSLTTEHHINNIYLTLVAYDEAAEVEVTMPADNRVLMPRTTLAAGRMYQLSLKNTTNENTALYNRDYATLANRTIQQRGICITSTAKIMVYFVTTNDNSEIYTLKGQHALGTDFIVPMQWRYRSGVYNSGAAGSDTNMKAHGSIEVVATEDDTHVTFVTPVATNESPQPDTIRVTLNRGETYAICSRTDDTPADQLLGGTRVTSDKPIAVNSTDDTATNFDFNGWGDKDLVGDQLVPTDLTTSQYIVVSNNSANAGLYEYVYLFAVEDGETDIYVRDDNTDTRVGTISPNNPLELKIPALTAKYIYSDSGKPFVCFQLTANIAGSELGGTMLPSINCSGSSQVSYMPVLNTTTVYVSLLTRTEYTDAFLVNGSEYDLPASLFKPVPGAPEWSFAACVPVSVSAKVRTLHIANKEGVFHLGILDSGSGSSSYGYFSNYSGLNMQVQMDQDYYYDGENIRLHLHAGELFDDIVWSGPRGDFGHNDTDPVISPITKADEGMYTVTGRHREGCDVTPAVFYINVLSDVDTTHMNVCANDSITLRTNTLPPYAWLKNDVPLAGETTDSLPILADAEDVYTILSYRPGYDMLQWDTLQVDLTTADSMIVWQQLFDNLLPGIEYQLSAHLTATQTNPVAPKVQLALGSSRSPVISVPNNSKGTEYTLSYMPDGLPAAARIIVKSPRDGRSFRIDRVSLTPILPDLTNLAIHLIHTLPPVIVGDTLLCEPTVELSSSIEADSYLWSTGETTPSIEVSKPGVYTLSTETDGCVKQSRPVTVLAVHRKHYALDPVTPVCAGDQAFSIPFANDSDIPTYCTIKFDSASLVGGLLDQEDLLVSQGQVSVPIPATVQPGYYNGQVNVEGDSCANILPLSFNMEIRYSADIFAQRWNDILGIKNAQYNGGYEFVSYEWYKNGTLLPEETGAYIYEPSTLQPGDVYSVVLTRPDGVRLQTCDYSPVHVDYEDDGLESLYNSMGQQVQRMNVPGVYIYKRGSHIEKKVVQ